MGSTHRVTRTGGLALSLFRHAIIIDQQGPVQLVDSREIYAAISGLPQMFPSAGPSSELIAKPSGNVHDRVGPPLFIRAVARPIDVLDDDVVQVKDLAASNAVV